MAKIIIATLLVVLVTIGIFAYGEGLFESKPALKLKVTTGLDENESIKVTNITFEQIKVSFFYKRTDSQVKFPEINTYARANTINTEPSSFWASTPLLDDIGIYDLLVVFRDGKEPNVNDTSIMPIKITDHKGKIIYKTTAFYEWTD